MGCAKTIPSFTHRSVCPQEFQWKVPLALIHKALLALLLIANCTAKTWLVLTGSPSWVCCAPLQPPLPVDFGNVSAAQSWPAHRPQARFQPPGFGLWLFFYSFIYVNSSSSRAALFLWTSHFFSMVARAYVAAKYVWRSAQNAGLADNNFGDRTFCVDNYLVVPELSPDLSTISCSWVGIRRKKARSPSKNSGPGDPAPGEGACGSGVQIDYWAGAGAAGLPSAPARLPWWWPWRPSPPPSPCVMPPMR
jgi:hypothetical protein